MKILSFKGIWSTSNNLYQMFNVTEVIDEDYYKSSFIKVMKRKSTFSHKIKEIAINIKVDLSMLYFRYI